jgi:hypothetical protein
VVVAGAGRAQKWQKFDSRNPRPTVHIPDETHQRSPFFTVSDIAIYLRQLSDESLHPRTEIRSPERNVAKHLLLQSKSYHLPIVLYYQFVDRRDDAVRMPMEMVEHDIIIEDEDTIGLDLRPRIFRVPLYVLILVARINV